MTYTNPGYTYTPAYTPAYAPVYQPQTNCGGGCRPVSGAEEAKAAQVPFDGNPYIFTNIPNGEIYVKQFNTATGSTDFVTYRREAGRQAVSYATTADLDALRAEFAAMIGKEVKANE